MNESASRLVFVMLFGQAVAQAVYLEGDKIKFATCLRLPDNLPATLTTLTLKMEEVVGHKINPSKIIISGTQTDLAELQKVSDNALFVPEEKALAAAERYLTTFFGEPTAILDVGPSAYLDFFPSEDIARWLPFIVNLTDIENHLGNKRRNLRVLPSDNYEYEIDQAVVRQAIIKLGERDGKDFLEVATSMNVVVTGGMLVGMASMEDLIGAIVDSFYFSSGARIMKDSDNRLTLLGALLTEETIELDLSTLQAVASILHLPGNVAKVEFRLQDKQVLNINPGDIISLPVNVDEDVEIEVSQLKSSSRHTLHGGGSGIYIDNRTRPLGLIAGSKDSLAKVLSWRKTFKTNSLIEEGNDITG